MNCLDENLTVKLNKVYIQRKGKTKKAIRYMRKITRRQIVIQLNECDRVGKVLFCNDFILSGGDSYKKKLIDLKYVKDFRRD